MQEIKFEIFFSRVIKQMVNDIHTTQDTSPETSNKLIYSTLNMIHDNVSLIKLKSNMRFSNYCSHNLFGHVMSSSTIAYKLNLKLAAEPQGACRTA